MRDELKGSKLNRIRSRGPNVAAKSTLNKPHRSATLNQFARDFRWPSSLERTPAAWHDDTCGAVGRTRSWRDRGLPTSSSVTLTPSHAAGIACARRRNMVRTH
eukprot:2967038-Pleurochrysis_carterae.AAC.5